MIRIVRTSVLLIAGALLAALLTVAGPETAEAHPACSAPVVTGSGPGLFGSSPSKSFDGNESSFYLSSFNGVQHVEVDLGCQTTFSGLRRKMGLILAFGRGPRIAFFGNRPQNEDVAYSTDGRQWTQVTHADSTGWGAFGPIGNSTWTTVPYGWSPKLTLDTPVQARFVRFRWTGAVDVLSELDIDYVQAPPLTLKLDCLRGEPVCWAKAGGGHPGTFTFNFTTTGVSNVAISPSGNGLTGTCTIGRQFTVKVTVTDGEHGRARSRSVTDTCLGPF